jgi:hypothetical protein
MSGQLLLKMMAEVQLNRTKFFDNPTVRSIIITTTSVSRISRTDTLATNGSRDPEHLQRQDHAPENSARALQESWQLLRVADQAARTPASSGSGSCWSNVRPRCHRGGYGLPENRSIVHLWFYQAAMRTSRCAIHAPSTRADCVDTSFPLAGQLIAAESLPMDFFYLHTRAD